MVETTCDFREITKEKFCQVWNEYLDVYFFKNSNDFFTIVFCLHFRINTQRKPIIRKQTEAIEENDSVLEKLWSGDRRLVFYKFLKPFQCTDVLFYNAM